MDIELVMSSRPPVDCSMSEQQYNLKDSIANRRKSVWRYDQTSSAGWTETTSTHKSVDQPHEQADPDKAVQSLSALRT